MSSAELLVRFYDLSGPKPWSPSTWLTRFALNYKGIPYTTVKVSYPGIKPLCEKLFPDMTDIGATVPIIEILQPPYQVLNDSTPIAKLLNERFTEKDGYKDLKLVDEVDEFDAGGGQFLGRAVGRWIINDVYENALDKEDGSREYFKTTRESSLGCELKDVIEVRAGGEAAALEDLKVQWRSLQERMAATYIDFYYASYIKWNGGASQEKLAKIMTLYEDDTFIKLMNKVEPWSQEL
ncbi:glutathione S-transferase protein [Rutstroemia sp. NJR-2017a WRK4]|nr:glutathione S-transferase protein [Rutstroemia sp. NJR-2017a WRK4]